MLSILYLTFSKHLVCFFACNCLTLLFLTDLLKFNLSLPNAEGHGTGYRRPLELPKPSVPRLFQTKDDLRNRHTRLLNSPMSNKIRCISTQPSIIVIYLILKFSSKVTSNFYFILSKDLNRTHLQLFEESHTFPKCVRLKKVNGILKCNGMYLVVWTVAFIRHNV